MMMLLAFLCGLLAATPAHADPISAAILGTIGVTAATTGGAIAISVLTMTISLGVSLGLSLLSRALFSEKPKAGEVLSGLETSVQMGGDVPRQIAIGRVGVKGQLVYHNTYGANNVGYERVFVLSDWISGGLNGVVINGKFEAVSVTSSDSVKTVYSVPTYAGLIGITLYNGKQTSADATLIANANPTGKWSTNDKLTGMTYAYVSFFYQKDSPLYANGIPDLTFDLNGAVLYDWRKDSTNGGSGTHRWNDPTTWEFSDNAFVAIYNFQRGFYLNSELIIGMGLQDYDLLLDTYTAAANACDENVSLAAGGTEKRYRIATVVTADDSVTYGQTLDVMLSACAGYLYDYSGYYYAQAGVAQTSVKTITDDDLRIGSPITFVKKRTRDALVNKIHGQFLDVAAPFAEKSYAAQVSSTGVTEDREERGIQLDLLCVPSQFQAERIAQVRLRENRRQATASITLGYENIALQAGDWITWNSTLHGNDTWRIVKKSRNADNKSITLELSQIASSVFSWGTSDEGAVAAAPIRLQPGGRISTVSAFGVAASTRPSADGLTILPTLRCFWTPVTDPTVVAVIVEYRIVGTTLATRVSDPTPGDGQLVIDGVTPGTNYEARATIETDPPRVTTWTSWVSQLTDSGAMFATSLADAIVNFDTLDTDLQAGFNAIDVTAPGDPTLVNANITSSIIRNSDGTITTRVVLDWPDVTSSNFANYELEVWQGTGTYLQSSPTASYDERWDFTPGVTINARVRSISKMGIASNWSSPPASHVVAVNTVKPADASGLTVTGRFQALDISWNAATESDYAYTEVWASSSSSFGSGSVVAQIRGTRLSYILPPGSQRWIWIRHVNTSGLASNNWHPSSAGAGVSGTTQQIVTADVAAAAIDQTKFANTLRVPDVVGALPSSGNWTGRIVTLTTDSKSYKWNGTSWVRAYGDDILGIDSIQATTIVAGAIGVNQLAAKAVTTTKLAVGSKNVAYNADIAIPGLKGFSFNDSTSGGSGFAAVEAVTNTPDSTKGVQLYKTGMPTGAGSASIINQPILQDGTPTYYTVTAGKYYQASACLSMYRATGAILIEWLNSSNAVISYSSGNTISNNQQSGGAIRDFSRSAVIAVAPAGAVKARVWAQAFSFTGPTDFYMIASCWMFAGAASDQTEADPYVDPGITIIDGGNVRTQSIVTDHMVAGTIHGDVLTAGTVNADRIAASTVLSSTVIVSGQTLATTATNANLGAQNPATRINSGVTTIDPGKILISGSTMLSDWRAGADVTKIAGGSIYTQSITTTQLAAGSVTTDRIAASAVSASRILSTDFSNVVPVGDFEETTGWTFTGTGGSGTIGNFGVSVTGQNCLKLDKTLNVSGSNFALATSNDFVPVKAGRVYELAGYVLSSGSSSAGFFLRVAWYTAAGVLNGTNDAASDAPITTGWVRHAAKFTAPANTAFARIQIYNYLTSTLQLIYVDAVSLKIASGGTLIEDDTIDTGHIRAASITSGKLSTGELITLSAQIKDGIILNAKIGNLEVTNAKIDVLTIGTDRIANNAISSESVTVNDISSGSSISVTKSVTAGTRILVVATIGSSSTIGAMSAAGAVTYQTWSINFNGTPMVYQYSPDTCIQVTYNGGSSYTFGKGVSPCTIIAEITGHATGSYAFATPNNSGVTLRMSIQVLELSK